MKRFLSLCLLILSVALLPGIVMGYNQIGSGAYWHTPSSAEPLDPIIIEYYINEDGDPGCINGDEFEAIQRAAQAWNDISTSKIQFEYQGETTLDPNPTNPTRDNVNVVGWVQSGWDELGLEHGAVAIARVFTISDRIREADLFINSEDYNWSASPDNACPAYRFDVQNMAAHESGHWCGLGDVNMFSDHHNQTMMQHFLSGDTEKRTLESDDIAGASFLYPYQVDWPDALEGVYYDPYHHFNVDVAISWDPTGKDEYLHLACLEGEEFAGSYDTLDTLLPFDAVVTPVRVVYGHNGITGWEKEILSDWSDAIRGPQLEIDGEDNVHIIWAELNAEGNPNRIVYRKRDGQTGTWDWPVVLREDYWNTWPKWPTIAVAHASTSLSGPHSDKVYAAWIEYNASKTKVLLMFTRSHNGGATWESPQQIAQADHIVCPKLALDSTHGVHVVWREETYGDPYDYLCWMKNSTYGASGSWKTKVAKQRHVMPWPEGMPSVAIDGYGYVHIVTAIDLIPDYDLRVHYDRIRNLGNGTLMWDSLGPISPANEQAGSPHVVCDNLGFVHFFWDDTRNYTPNSNPRKVDVFHSRNFHMGDDLHWEEPKNGSKIYIFSPHNTPYTYLSDVAQPDTFGDLFVGVDVKWPTLGDNWDVYATLGRQDDLVRVFPWPPGQAASFETVDEETSPDIKPQGCYLSASLNRLFYFAPTEAQLSCYSVDGRRVHEQKLKGAGQLELNSLPSGTYFAHLKSTDGSSSRTKIVVIH